jgi:hypothetical protein
VRPDGSSRPSSKGLSQTGLAPIPPELRRSWNSPSGFDDDERRQRRVTL